MAISKSFFAINAFTKEHLPHEFKNASTKEIDIAVAKGSTAFGVYRKKSNEDIANFLEQIATEIFNLGTALIDQCHLETALPIARLEGERGRTINQLRLFASIVRDGSWVDARIDTAIPDRAPIPRPDIRQMLLPLGAVAVFGASNFPLAFSVAGGDTASALAAGCPVIVKGHEAHPNTSEMIANAIEIAIEKCGMPEGTFSLIQGNTKTVGEYLVKHPSIKAVGFTGSFAGGKAISAYAKLREEPIPVFAEMGSTNPVFVLPNALKSNATTIAKGMAQSISLGVGQFCTNPGLFFVEKGAGLNTLYEQLRKEISSIPAGTMLTPKIEKGFSNGVKHTLAADTIEVLAKGQVGEGNKVPVIVLKTSFEHYIKTPFLSEENFGPSSIIIEVSSKAEMLAAADNLKGQLTATAHAIDEDLNLYKELFETLEQKAGRVLFNGFPTGVEVCHAMVHGGPYPATTASQSTSVGANAIKRFVRPVCFQNYPEALLPKALQNENKLHIWRMVNGEMKR